MSPVTRNSDFNAWNRSTFAGCFLEFIKAKLIVCFKLVSAAEQAEKTMADPEGGEGSEDLP